VFVASLGVSRLALADSIDRIIRQSIAIVICRRRTVARLGFYRPFALLVFASDAATRADLTGADCARGTALLLFSVRARTARTWGSVTIRIARLVSTIIRGRRLNGAIAPRSIGQAGLNAFAAVTLMPAAGTSSHRIFDADAPVILLSVAVCVVTWFTFVRRGGLDVARSKLAVVLTSLRPERTIAQVPAELTRARLFG
jgi:hypothetical protein